MNKYYQMYENDYVEIISAPNHKEARKIGVSFADIYFGMSIRAVKNGSSFYYGEAELPFTVKCKGILKTFTKKGRVDFKSFIKELHRLNQIEIDWQEVIEIFEMLEIDLPNDFKTYNLIELNEIIERG